MVANINITLDKAKLRSLILASLGFLLPIVVFHAYYWDKAFPGIQIPGTDVSGKTQEQITEAAASLHKPDNITLVTSGKKYDLAVKDLGIEYRNTKTAARVLEIGRKGNIAATTKDKLKALTKGINVPLSIVVETQALDKAIETVAKDLFIPSIEPSVNIQNKNILVNPGKEGQEVKKEELREKIYTALTFVKTDEIEVPLQKTNPPLNEIQIQILKERAQKLAGKQIQISFEQETFNYTDQDLITILGTDESFVNREKAQTLASDLASGVNRDPQNARFEFRDGKVQEFTPSKNGVAVKENDLLEQLKQTLNTLAETDKKSITINLPVESTKPEVANEDVNNLGINELIGQGESIYRGSIPSRVHNLSLAASRLNGILIRPGEEFSFNKAVGDISTATGYQQAFVIKEGKTILDDGGGVCQTSTTFFRAALNSGLPILERHQHSYRVSYYENGSKPGYDAAIYLPSIDLRLKNDTPAHILIQTKNDSKNSKLVFEFYGTADGRKAEVVNYRQWDARPAPPDLYQDDPTLSTGTVKQIEKSIPGLKTAFDYKVTKDGETVFEKTFFSNFRPWQAVYLRGAATN